MACIASESADGGIHRPLNHLLEALAGLRDEIAPFLKALPKSGPHADRLAELDLEADRFARDAERFGVRVHDAATEHEEASGTNDGLNTLVGGLAPLLDSCSDLAAQADQLYKTATGLIEACEQACDTRANDAWNTRYVTRARKTADEARRAAVDQFGKVRYFWRQAHWLTGRFPDGVLRDVPGLVKLVDRADIEANDWSLAPGRYVGIAPQEEDEDFDFATAMREIHAELADLNAEAAGLAQKIQENFERLGI